jgi:serine/threonine protein kinase
MSYNDLKEEWLPPPDLELTSLSLPPPSPIRSPVSKFVARKNGTGENMDSVLSPTSEIAFDRVLRSVASKVWNDEKDAVLLQELESVLDPQTFSAIVTPFHMNSLSNTVVDNNNNNKIMKNKDEYDNNRTRPHNLRNVTSSLPIDEDEEEEEDEILAVASNTVDSHQWQNNANIFEEEGGHDVDVNIQNNLKSEPGIVLVSDITTKTFEESRFNFWDESFDRHLLNGTANVPVSGSRAAMLVSLKREVEEEEEDAKKSTLSPTEQDLDDNEEEEDTEDEWDDDDDEGYISVQMSLKEFLRTETSNIEVLNENANHANIRPSSVWIRAREEGLEDTFFSGELDQNSDSEDEEDLQQFHENENKGSNKSHNKNSTADFQSEPGDGVEDATYRNRQQPGGNTDVSLPKSKVAANSTTDFTSRFISSSAPDNIPLNHNIDALDSTTGSSIGGNPLYLDGGFLDKSLDKSRNNISDDDDNDDDPIEYEAFTLKIVHERHKTGFEAEKDLKLSEGCVVAGRYVIESMVGEASFSTAWKAIDRYQIGDTSKKDKKRVCLKVIKNNKDFLDQSLDEIKLLRYLNAAGDVDAHHILRLYDYFYFKEHLFISTELLRDNLYEFSRYNRESGDTIYFNLRRIRMVAQQCLEALDYMHSLGLIHCDLKPENILIKSYSKCQIKVIDFGASCYITDHLTSYIQSRSYRAPEVLLGCVYGQKIDVWSLGCILAELWTGTVLFHNHSVASLLSRIIAIIGPFPKLMLAEGVNVPKYFTASNRLYESTLDVEDDDASNSKTYTSRTSNEEEGYILLYPKKTSLKHRLRVNYEKFIDFMDKLLQIDPNNRMSTRQALNHPFLKNG